MEKSKILIIDNEEDILYTIQEIAKFAGHEVVTALDGMTGFELYTKEKPDLVIVDYHMPGWNGLMTVKKIMSHDPSASILVLTVDERQEIADKFMEEGAADFAIKPIKAPDLIARITVNLKIRKIQQETLKPQESVFVDKGIGRATLYLVKEYFEGQKEPVTIEEAAQELGLAYQTVHRYVHHLLQRQMLDLVHEYGQLGRPKNKYIYNSKNEEK